MQHSLKPGGTKDHSRRVKVPGLATLLKGLVLWTYCSIFLIIFSEVHLYLNISHGSYSNFTIVINVSHLTEDEGLLLLSELIRYYM
jgi:hypothetical protein